jgi:preprotein translocase subunit YajC
MSTETTSALVTFIPIILMVALMYFLMIRPQNKKEKKVAEMRNSIEVGDEITTIGGIVGRVASIKEDTFVLETGSDRVKLRFKRWAIQDVQKLTMDNTTTSESK